ncbi:MAG: hypothetical protein ACFN0Z_05210, partial [Parascardovia denticolens]
MALLSDLAIRPETIARAPSQGILFYPSLNLKDTTVNGPTVSKTAMKDTAARETQLKKSECKVKAEP